MSLRIAARIARRELRGGLSGFRVLIACLALGVAAIAAVGSVRESIETGLAREGATILGGDASVELTYRFATDDERAYFDSIADTVSEIADFRSMASVGEDRALTQVKAVDGAYPLLGAVKLAPDMALSDALAGQDGLPGAVMDPLLIDRLGLSIGDPFRIGDVDVILTAALEREPDSATGGFTLGPRTIVNRSALAESGLLAPGTLYESEYRLRLPQGSDLDALEARTREALDGAGMRWRDSRNGAPGVARFVERLSDFLILVGLAGLAVGGVGVSSAVRAYLDRKTAVIATLKTLGAQRGTIFAVYFLQIGVLTVLATVIGLILGGVVPILLSPLIEAQLPVPAEMGLYPRPLLEAGIFGLLTAALFTLWPLARAEQIRPAALFRDAATGLRGLPRPLWIAVTVLILATLIGAAVLFTGSARLALWTAGGIFGAFLTLLVAAWLVRGLARWAAHGAWVKGRTALRLALASVGGPASEAGPVVLSLGLGLSVLAAVGQIDANLRGAIASELPEAAPSYFVVDIQNDQIDAFRDRLRTDPGVSRFESAPMLRGVITEINGKDAETVAGAHWVLRGDRGITYSDAPPAGTTITDGVWWPKNFDGSPRISFAAEEAKEMGLTLGDTLTVNVLGRDIVGTITSFREVDFSNAGMGFVLSMSPNALEGAPHTHIATIYADSATEAPLMRDLARTFPNITTIRVRDAIERVASVMEGIAAATTYAALATLFTGAVVLIGAAAAGERERRYEAAVLKTVGASRATILRSFALRSVLMGLAAAGVAIACGGIAGWAVMTRVMEGDFRFEPVSALVIVAGGVAITLLTSIGFSWRALAARPARVLRSRE